MFVIFVKGGFIDYRCMRRQTLPVGSLPIAMYDAEKGILKELIPLPRERIVAYIREKVMEWADFWQTEADLIGKNNAVKRVSEALENITYIAK